MRKGIKVLLKFIVLFFSFIVLGCIFEIPSSNPAIWRFGAELLPLLSIVIISIIFYFFEKRNLKVIKIKNPFKNIFLGVFLGIIWLGVPLIILFIFNKLSLISVNNVSYFGVWSISCLLNVVMQELLIRGYLYQLLKREYNIIISILFTTLLFTFLHGGAFEAGVVPVLNVITMSILMSVLLEFSETILLPIVMHFIWNFFGSLILGLVSLAEDYPNLLNISINGNNLFSGGNYQLEGSILVFFINFIFIIVFSILVKKNK